jgi:hypothetical protein
MNTIAQPKCPQAKWTVLLYSAADNNLKDALIRNVTDLETVGSDSYTNLVAQVDTGDQVNRYLLQKVSNGNPDVIGSQAVETLQPQNMSDPQTLADFIKWGVQKYPAEHYMVIVSDHGDGWQGAVEDDSHGGWMSLPQIREGFEKAQADTGKKIDIIGFDACLMASAEVTHELKDVCDYQVVSEETEGAAGWPYSRIANPDLLKHVQQMHLMKINVEPRELAIQAVKDSQGTQDVLPTMSAIDSSKVQDVTSAVDGLAKAIVANQDDSAAIGDAANSAQSFYDYKDATDFANRIANNANVKDDALKAAAQNLSSAVSSAVIAEEHSQDYPDAHGLTLEIGTWGVRNGYDQTRLGQETQWPAALQKMSGAGSPAPTPDPSDPTDPSDPDGGW